MRPEESFRNGGFDCGRQPDASADAGRLDADDSDEGRQVAKEACGSEQFQRVASMGSDRAMSGEGIALEPVDGAGWRPQRDGIEDDQGAAAGEVREKGKSPGAAIEELSGRTLGGESLQQAQAEGIIAEEQVTEPED
jgi:hypothetical protein